MKTNTPVNKAISLSMMITLGLMMASGASAAAQSKKECLRRERGHDNRCDRWSEHSLKAANKLQHSKPLQ